MFTGLSAFPLTPFKNEQVDAVAFARLIHKLVDARVNSICAMGSTGLYPYLSREEFSELATTAVELAGNIPVMVGVGALRTDDVLRNIDIAQTAGVEAVLLAPVSYHPLRDCEVYALYEKVTQHLSVPLCVYENPNVTNFVFSDDLYRHITRLPNVAAIKIPGQSFHEDEGKKRLDQLRQLLPDNVAIGVSGDKFGAAGMAVGCDLWLSVLGGLFPNTVKYLISKAKEQGREVAMQSSQKMEALWQLFTKNNGGMRVMATAASILGLTEYECLPHPLRPLDKEDRVILEALITELMLT
ncbi:dihydrodipicolinate synthase family protein [Agaribacter flavus]|uniref:Dihydrodipicolinate synthase family protein n=1 Tax=Agaribacter flavus TaxID=1902781 RepID=A0ABV7FN73_9ALTE